MNGQKMNQLIRMVRQEHPPLPPPGFDHRVVAAARGGSGRLPASLCEQLDRLFPRLAVAALVLIGLCLMADIGHSAMAGPGLEDGVDQLVSQWLFVAKGF